MLFLRDVLEVLGWLLRGAVREDDGALVLGWYLSNYTQPLDDPNGPLNRFCNHFFDPFNNRKLSDFLGTTSCNFDAIATAPVWALGIKDDGTIFGGLPTVATQVPNPDSRNHFNIADAHEAMWRALTLKQYKDQNGILATEIDVPTSYSGAPFTDVSSWPTAPTQVQLKNAYWATMFRALGDVMHLNEDMAQPQHVRNESHPALERKFYEAYIEDRATLDIVNDPVFIYDFGAQSLIAVSKQPLNFTNCNGVPCQTPKFNNFSDFWATSEGAFSSTGHGLANYSNQGFFTTAHNYGEGTYPNPPSPNPPESGGYTFTQDGYLIGTVIDKTGVGLDAPGTHMTRLSIWDNAMRLTGVAPPDAAPNYTLDHTIFDDYVNLLIPHATAFSAGLLDHFFRGQMEISLPDEGVYAVVDHATPDGNDPNTGGFPTVKLKLKNLTTDASGNSVIEPMGGGSSILVAVAKFHRNLCYQPDLSGEYGSPGKDWNTCRSKDEEIVVSKSISVPAGINSAPQEVTFDFSQKRIPPSASDLYLQVVYRGPLGAESDAVVVVTKDISEPTYLFGWSMADIDPSCASYASIDDCPEAFVDKEKFRYSPTSDPIPGYDPNNPQVPLNGGFVSQELPFNPVVTMPIPAGRLTRVAILADANPSNVVLEVAEQDFPIKDAAYGWQPVFGWGSTSVSATINQLDFTTNTLTPSVTYMPARGFYIPYTDFDQRVFSAVPSGTPNYVLWPSGIIF